MASNRSMDEASAEFTEELSLVEILTSLGLIVGCTLFAGLMSGLTVGLLSLDPLNLRVIEQNGSAEEQRQAATVRPLLERHHLLLVTLLLANAAAMESLPLFLDRLFPQWAAVCISVTLVLLFGEVLPQAICTGPNRLAIGAFFTPFVHLIVLICSPIAWPLAKALDYILGKHEMTLFDRGQLKTLINLHVADVRSSVATPPPSRAASGPAGMPSDPSVERAGRMPSSSSVGLDDGAGGTGSLLPEEGRIIGGVLSSSSKDAESIMVAWAEVVKRCNSEVLDGSVLQDIARTGRSRLPIVEAEEPDDVRGVLLVSQLVEVRHWHPRPLVCTTKSE